ncbi:hypothetical protein LPJ53_005541 [Coemansia erecta]|uniref:Uncharacterized protein n=1 Tax=Coemansia erecta TaxID=147472 RepID=A0A9W7XXC1_9FUNG|nr:hypothetical protein LPJ53_005541 [Coemansia erecta]
MDVSNTATFGRRTAGRNGDIMRELRAQLAAEPDNTSSSNTATPDPDPEPRQEQQQQQQLQQQQQQQQKADEDDEASSDESSDVEDIDRGTAIITVYNLLSNLGDLNQSNRWVAEGLAQKFSSLQVQVDRTESLVSEGGSLRRTPHDPPSPHSASANSGNSNSGSGARSISTFSESTFHTPPVSAGVVSADAGVQTDIDGRSVAEAEERARRLDEENRVLKSDIVVLVESLREQQTMARDYEATLARALVALRSAAFERHVEIAEVQNRYRELLASEKTLNDRLECENSELRGTLGKASDAMRTALETGVADDPPV